MPDNYIQRLITDVLIFLVALLLAGQSVAAADVHAPTAKEFDALVAPFVTKWCSDCHNENDSEGNTNLTRFKSLHELLEERKPWQKVLKQLKAGAMPPDGVERPDDAERARVIEWLERAVTHIDTRNRSTQAA